MLILAEILTNFHPLLKKLHSQNEANVPTYLHNLEVLSGQQKYDNLQNNTVGGGDDSMIVLASDGLMFILIDWK